MSQKAWIVGCALFVGAICSPLAQHWMAKRNASTGPGSTEVAKTRQTIIRAGEQLAAIDRKGDVQGATGMLDTVIYLLRNIDAAPFQTAAMQNCKLAAAHLADGVMSVAQGGVWGAKSRYENALADCR